MNIKELIELTTHTLEAARKPATKLAAILVYATSVQRPGVSKLKIASEIISENASLGIETGKMPDGGDNIVNSFVYNVVEKVIDNLKDDALV